MNRIKQLILAGISLLLVTNAAAKEDPANIIVLRGDKGGIKKDSSITNADSKYYADPAHLSYDPATCRYLNIIALKINEESPYYIPVNFQVSVPLTVTCTDVAERTISFDTTLTLTYRKDAKYIAKSFIIREGYRKVIVKIKENLKKDVDWDVSQVLVVENEMRISRDYLFNYDKIIENLSANFPKRRGIDQTDELLVSWNDPNCGQSEYDLEWAWLDSSALAEYKVGTGNVSDRIIFDQNASRVTISANTPYYRLPLMYDGGGVLFYRVRPAQIKQNGTRLEGRWTNVVNGVALHAFAFRGHQNNLSWQVTTTYAEEGKRKTVIQYFDGTLRNRQTVTKDHSQDTATTVVGETFYDYQGRPAIQVLPAPTLNTIIGYTKKFNQGINSGGVVVEYTKDLYDRVEPADTICKKPATAMSTVSGASQYYSTNNPIKSEGINAYIPDANNYPFAETRYTPDATGRIASQSGVGVNHLLGSGHETKYYYGQADQEDLDPLFGTDVGYASHYFKNMVRDANGQYSVSYVDMHGRTVATALAGKSPENLDSLPSQIARTNITKNLLDKETNLIKDRSIEAVKELLVPVNGTYRFQYQLQPETLLLKGDSICYSCMYDLTITLSDDCNNCSLPNKAPLVINRSNFSLANLDSVCSRLPAALLVDTTINLKEGSYSIRKTLTLSSDAQNNYRTGLFTRRNTIKTFEGVRKETLTLIQGTLGSCILSCDDCRKKLGDYDTYKKNIIAQSGLSVADTALQEPTILAAYNQTKAGCDAICSNGSNRITDLRKVMLLDVTPSYGQYAEPENSNSGRLYNIFSPGNTMTSGDRYKRPVNETTGAPDCYVNNNGNSSGLCSINLGGTTPLATMTKDEFATVFQSNWANSLLYYHPEYPRLQLAETTLKPSYNWDNEIQQINSWSGAAAIVKIMVDADPFLNLPGNTFYKEQMNTKVASNFYRDSATGKQVSMWQVAWGSVFCKSVTGSESCITNTNNKTPAGFVVNAACAKDWDNVWGAFRQLYLFEKEKMVYEWSNQHITNPISTTTLVSNGYTPRFIDPSNLSAYPGGSIGNIPSDTTKAKQVASDSTYQFYKDNCTANAAQWQEQLLTAFHQCDSLINSITLAPLINQLITICVKGSDIAHPFGSSSISPDSIAAAQSYRSFPEAIAAFMAAKGMRYTPTCNPFILENTRPYQASPSYYNQEIWTKPDSCSCNRITTLKAEAAAKGYTTENGRLFADYLQQYYNTTITQGALDTLEGRCKGTLMPSCNMIDQAIYLPPILQCISSQPVCMNCSTMKTYTDSFNALLKVAAPVQNPLNASDSSINIAYERYMNYQTGFGYSYVDYLEFKDACVKYGLIREVYTSDCSNLEKIAADYQKLQSNTYDSCNSVKWKVNNGFATTVYLSTCAAIDSGRLHLPPAYQNTTQPKEFNYSDPNICMPDILTVEYRIRAPKSATSKYNVDLGLVFGNNKFISITLVPSAFSTDRGYVNIDNVFATYQNPIVDLGNWQLIKIQKLASEYRFYVNNVFIASYLHNHHNYDSIRFSTLLYNTSTELDWMKIYDEHGTTIYDEQFSSNIAFNKFNKNDRCETKCADNFKRYFNERRGTKYSSEQINSIYLTNCGSPSPLSADSLARYTRMQTALNGYFKKYSRTDTVYQTQMVTLGGNATPAIGPKGVFDVNGNLIGNTIDGSDTSAIQASFVKIWNSSVVNQKIGTLSLLTGGNFGLRLKAGQVFPCKGIIGMRYYQFDTDTTLVDGIQTGIGSYLDFGDGGQTAFDGNARTSINSELFVWPPATHDDLARSNLLHTYTGYALHHYKNVGSHTITVYHTDTLGLVSFDNFNSPAVSLPHFRNLRGYFPAQTVYLSFHGTQDSTFNSFKNIQNFATLKGLQYFRYGSGDYGLPDPEQMHRYENNRLNFKRAHRGLRWVELDLSYFPTGRPFMGVQPISTTLPGWDSVYTDLEGIFISNFSQHITKDVHFNFPKLKVLNFIVAETGGVAVSEVDRIINEIAASTTVDSGYLRIDYAPVLHSAASAASIQKLKDRGWQMVGNAVNDGGVDNYTFLSTNHYLNTWRSTDTIPYTNAFTQYYNQQMACASNTYGAIEKLYRSIGKELKLCNLPAGFGIEPTLCGKSEPLYPQVQPTTNSPCKDAETLAINKVTEYYTYYKDSLANVFDTAYYSACIKAKDKERFTVTHGVYEFHYTLYYYDQAGNLVKTVPPAGVQANYNATWLRSVQTARSKQTALVPLHTLVTQYRYNTLGQVIEQQSPDAGKSNFWYDRLGRLVVSQNAKQVSSNLYSYTLYDPLGRITEVGQRRQATTAMTQPISQDAAALNSWFNNSSAKEQLTRTIYDTAYQPFTNSPTPLWQRNLRSRVSHTQLWDNATDSAYKAATYYSYDIHGNVDTLLQDINQGSMKSTYNRFKKIVYNYDLISGKVNTVSYQPGGVDAFYHKYFYDAENRLTDVQTSRDKIVWEHDAKYSLYKHGPLSRLELGQQKVQGLDYAYALPGWMKGLNSTYVGEGLFDMGGDGKAGTIHALVARDVIGFALHYYQNESANPIRYDYKPIGSTNLKPFANPGISSAALPIELYNGNIAAVSMNIPKLGTALLSLYKYDQLNRIKKSYTYTGLAATNSWDKVAKEDYREQLTYDANGNIKTYKRNGDAARLLMDNMTYTYKPGTNKLDKVVDAATDVAASAYDKYNDIKQGQRNGNYQYDAIGNLVSDTSEGISNIVWNVYGKIQSITKASGTITYTYDASGNRISKTTGGKSTFYVRDASGNVMSVYEKDIAINGGDLTQIENHLYGSSRLGINTFPVNVEHQLPTTGVLSFWRGYTAYELSNHLGNVLVTVSDRRMPHTTDGTTIDYYEADVASAQDYYPGGMLMPGRKYSAGSSSYRYGFQNQETDPELWSGAVNFSYRVEDPRLVRFFSIDPLTSSFPWNSPYAFSENRLIDGIEMEGLEVVLVNQQKDATIYNVGINNKDKSAVHIYAHATPSNIDMGGGNWSHSAKDFQAVLQKSDVYNNAKSTERVVVVLHSCRAGRSYFDESGNYVPSVAEQLSASFPNLTIIAPDERDHFSSDGREIGPKQIKYPGNKRADYAAGKPEESNGVFGNWNVFEGGKWTGQYDSDYDPSSAPGGWDRRFNYNSVKISITGTVTSNSLNVRSSAGFGNNKIGNLNKGTSVNLTGNTNGSWSEISLDGGGTGWISTGKIKQNIIVNINDEKKK